MNHAPIMFIIAVLACIAMMPLAARMGAHDVRRWVTSSMHRRLHHTPLAWWAMAMACAIIMVMSAPSRIAAGIEMDSIVVFLPSWLRSSLALVLCGMLAALLTSLARIDLCCRMLPDRLTLMLVATGLAFHALTGAMALADAVIGAVAGYAALWILAWCFARWRHVQAMGRGDLAMTAGLGAWLGWEMLPLMLTLASVAALLAIAAHRMWLSSRFSAATPSAFMQIETAFGPALALGAMATWVQLG